MLIDTHCHLTDAAFAADLGAVLERSWQSGVGHIVVIGESRVAAERALALAAAEPRLSATAGIHPHDARGFDEAAAAWLRGALADPVAVAVGETGLDYHYDHSPRNLQRVAFERQLDLAANTGKPAVIHAREADEDVAAILRAHPRAAAILHSFSGGPGLLRAALELGHYISFSGMITFKNWRLDEIIGDVPLDRLLIETDAPYLAPAPQRGRRNEPALVRFVADRLAAVRRMPVEEMIALTGANALRVFGPRLQGA